MKESAAGIESPDSGLYEVIEERIKTAPHTGNERADASRFCWTNVISGLRTLFLQPRFAWGVAAIQTAIIIFFIISPPAGLRAPGHSYKTLSATTATNSTQDFYLVIFHDSVPMTSVEKLLRQAHATITDGPGENGILTLKISGDDPTRKEAARILENSPMVIFMTKQSD